MVASRGFALMSFELVVIIIVVVVRILLCLVRSSKRKQEGTVLTIPVMRTARDVEIASGKIRF